jgi:lysophospholipase L1-like esterase
MKTFINVAQMKLATLQAGQFVETGGYYVKGDAGQARYLVVAGVSPDDSVSPDLANGNHALYQGVGAVNDLSQAYIFDTVALFKASSIEFPDGKTIHLNDRDADFIKGSAAGVADGNRDIVSTVFASSIIRQVNTSPKKAMEVGRIVPATVRNIACGIDSLTAGSAGSTYLDYFIPSVKAHLGSDGLGYQAFDLGSSNYWGVGFGRTGTSDILITDVYGKKSFDGRGQVIVGGNGTQSFTWNPATAWSTARVYYLTSASGGTFKAKLSTQNDLNAVDVDTSGADGIGFIDIEYFGDGGIALVFNTMVGDVCIFGARFGITGVEGGSVHLMAQGGRTLESVALQNDTFYQNWIGLLEIDTFVLNSGTNDRITRTTAEFEADYRTLITRIQSANASANIMIVTGNSTADAATTNKNQFGDIEKSLADEFGFIYFDNRDVLGSYQYATDNGLMSDTVHPSEKANKIISRYICEALGFTANGYYGGEPAHPSAGGGADFQFIGELTRVTKNQQVAATPIKLYNIGLANDYPVGILTIEIIGNRHGTDAQTRRVHRIGLQNTTQVNQVTAIDTPSQVDDYQQAAGDSGVMDWTIDFSIVDNTLEVSITPTAYTMNLQAFGRVEFSKLTASGNSVFENTTV